ncbi:DUF1684 domain-containing protein [Hymenobacter sp. ASUV-10]|uniref:DUF1684 domain-containing protein n=1 Tax=Hymenobacter aranciens TaxID=3063996 RepID=A0ABT9BG52_9BACT|nr:DUF1684 domain-containing protein [Hymenobacter sp. ASUV-10]MDO7877248.1 DUF1684 domain-containing protein [Hymenobacter sp. ASUV-10]
MASINKLRREKNTAFRTSPESPIPDAQRARFDSLKYYPAAPEFAFAAAITRNPNPDTVIIQTSTNEAVPYLRWGLATFELADEPQKLTLFRKANGADSTLFIPFTDLSNGRETYGGGRYLDVARPKADVSEIELDFNQAYNPYCAYNDEYSCPVPPAENRLSVIIPAGEKSFHD